MPTDVETLMEMGFSRNRSEKALHKTGYKSVQIAMDWLFAHEGDPDIDDPFEAPKGNVLGKVGEEEKAEPAEESTGSEQEAAPQESSGASQESSGAQPQEAKSLKCDDCGRVLRTVDEAEFHAAKTGHANFSESTEEKKALTEEEKKEQMAKLQDRLKQKRLEKAEQTKKDALQQEKLRRMSGKEVAENKAKMQEKEMKKLMEERKREKEEERLARQKVREQIEKDKKERAKKFAKAGTTDAEQTSAPAATAPAAAALPPQQQEKKDYDQCRIQIRLPSGQPLTQTFGAKEPLAAVRLYIQMNRTDGDGPFSLMTSFPRKVFNEEDMERPLADLGLVPSAVLMVTKG